MTEQPACLPPLAAADVLGGAGAGAADAIVGRETVEARGGRVVRVTIEPGWSTTSILEKVRRQP